MKTIELVSCEDYVLSMVEIDGFYTDSDLFGKAWDYARLLKQPLTLGMFVPCDEDGKPLENPLPNMKITKFIESIGGISEYNKHPMRDLHRDYQQAIYRVIFEGFELIISDEGVALLKKENSLMWFSKQIIKYDYRNVKSISDLTGYGLKVKMK